MNNVNYKGIKYVPIMLQKEPKVFPHWGLFFWSLTAFKGKYLLLNRLKISAHVKNLQIFGIWG